ncbi:sarcosine oxidase subunit gamma [Pseudoroseicyclus tamaricis]|uniref:Sarcosine oxidase subunit gamma n=1 Tax=Pseudoroseicyclus tamaricis TaxID=2705421 RepID=A0A6B2JES6_9RHOB|nr:sarcosine oxidase subunit gamma [Pseudoroseicyclus tamaricis]NDU99410.1 sarcosine oxidase subunit gamma [Pseudoroseicyclus tamaricis]
MPRLFEAPAFAELPALPGLSLAEGQWGVVTEVAPFKGELEGISSALQEAFGLDYPAPGESQTGDKARLLWVGPGRALLIGAEPPEWLGGRAALTGQTGAQAVLLVDGPAVEAVLARLVPVDLSAEVFPEGRTARTLIGHMTASVTRLGPATFELVVMRSMSGSLLHDLTRTARQVAARP